MRATAFSGSAIRGAFSSHESIPSSHEFARVYNLDFLWIKISPPLFRVYKNRNLMQRNVRLIKLAHDVTARLRNKERERGAMIKKKEQRVTHRWLDRGWSILDVYNAGLLYEVYKRALIIATRAPTRQWTASEASRLFTRRALCMLEFTAPYDNE